MSEEKSVPPRPVLLIKGGHIVNAPEPKGFTWRPDSPVPDPEPDTAPDKKIPLDEYPIQDVLCKDGKIVLVEADIDVEDAKRKLGVSEIRVLDATGKAVIPGGIDPHTHFELPFMGEVSCDTFDIGTAAGLAGGTTMVIDFVIPPPKKSLIEAFADWRRKSAKAAADYGFHVAVTWWNEGESGSDGKVNVAGKEVDNPRSVGEQMSICVNELGVNSFKMFMAYKGALMIEDDGLCSAFEVCRDIGAIAQVHAENGELVARGQERVFNMGITGPEGHALSRPPDTEAEATNRAIAIADWVKVPLYVVHVSCSQAADAISRARAENKVVFGEPVAAFLGADSSQYLNQCFRRAAGFVMSPPIRSKDHQVDLIKKLKTREMSLVGTDNCTFTASAKKAGENDFRKIPNGVNGVEDRMSVVWNQCVARGTMTPAEFVEVTSTMAARIFNIYPRKGAIQAGSDADIVIWNPDAKRTISADTHHHADKFNIFEGLIVRGVAEITISQGRVVWEDGELNAPAGVGQYIEMPPFSPIAYDALTPPPENRMLGVPVNRQKYEPHVCSCLMPSAMP